MIADKRSSGESSPVTLIPLKYTQSPSLRVYRKYIKENSTLWRANFHIIYLTQLVIKDFVKASGRGTDSPMRQFQAKWVNLLTQYQRIRNRSQLCVLQLDYMNKALGISPLHNFPPILFCSGFSIYLFSIDLKSDSWILVNQSKIYQILVVFLNAVLIKVERNPARTLWSFFYGILFLLPDYMDSYVI